jgi:Pvc16 N-terminal domain/Carboxypeptidase regulatory-like domain
MIDDLSKTLKFILSSEAKKEPKVFPNLAAAEIEFARPLKDYKPKPPQTVCLFLYDIRENRELRSNEPSRVMRDGKPVIERPPLRVDCSYLVTAWPAETTIADPGKADQETAGDLVLLEHLLLSEVLQVLARYPVIPSELLQGKLANPMQEIPPPMITARAEGLNNISEFWTAIGSNLRPSLSVKATISMQTSPPEVEAKPVLERIFREDKPTRLDIQGVVKDDKGAAVAGARIMIQELGLSAMSDAGGNFSFSQIPIGKYNLRVNWKTDKGVKSKSVEINVPAAAGAYDVELKG